VSAGSGDSRRTLDLAAFESGLALGETPLGVRAVAAGWDDALPPIASNGADGGGRRERERSGVRGGYDLGGNGQDSGADSWIGASERSADALGAYREAFQTVLKDWQGP
jgi:hypothetical protein